MKLIPLNSVRSRKYFGLFAKVSDEDYDWLMQYKWSASKSGGNFYATTSTSKRIPMHRMILGLTNPKIKGDHKDRDTLNNQRSNLRKATNSQNQMNKKPCGKSKYLGVSWHKTKWKASISIAGKTMHIGLFDSEIDAALAYDNVARKAHGEFANPNFK